MERLRGVGLDPRLIQWADELYKENEPYRRAVKGGTGQKEYTTGDLLYASDKFTLAKLGIGSTGEILTVAGGLPSWEPAATPAAPGWELIDEYEVSGSAVASVTFSGLDGDTDEVYMIEVYAIQSGATGNAIVLRPNSDNTANNYRYQYSYAANASITAARADFTGGYIVLNTSASGSTAIATAEIWATSGRRRPYKGWTVGNVDGTAQDIYNWGQIWKNTADNITSLFYTSTAGGTPIAVGSLFRLFKLVRL
jgi:hypothetical protein